MRAGARYLLADAVRRKRVLAPLAFYLFAVVGTYVYNNNLVRDSMASTAVLLFAAAAWLGVAVGGAEPDSQRQITSVALGGIERLLVARALAASVLLAPLVVFALVEPIVVGAFERAPTASDLALGAAAHVLCATAGLVLGGALAPPAVRRPAWALATVIAVFALGVPVDTAGASAPHGVRPLAESPAPALATARALSRSSSDGRNSDPSLLSTTLSTLVFAGVTGGTGLVLARRRA
jgi:hypothetical protein